MPSDTERRPVAMRNAALSVRNLKRSLRVLETLGVDPSLGASPNLMDQVTLFRDKFGLHGSVTFS